MKKVAHKVSDFLFNLKVDNIGLLSKIILGFALINIIVLLPDVYDLYSTHGYIQTEINDIHMYEYNPLLHWLLSPLAQIGLTRDLGLLTIISIYIASLFFAFLNYRPFTLSVVAWIIHVMIVNSSYYFSYGADYFITFALFANVLFNLEHVLKNIEMKNILKSFAVRMAQIQLCFVYFFAGFGKLVGLDWLNGNAMWYVMNAYSPEFIKNMMPSLVDFPLLFNGICWSILILELSYPILIYIDKLKRPTIYAVILMHLGIMFIMGLYTFGLIMIVLNIIAFGYYPEPLFKKKRNIPKPILVPNAT